ncbi:hypothetical protein AYO40_04135 [Planctomycetaceae bacterium SCGC AG-212-D15]|nr:hypothetical protein AYO40_04135 [Planctomycetaceae bacterium SCGC AG-212-D15]
MTTSLHARFALIALVLALGCAKEDPTGGDRPKDHKGNPITEEKGKIGQGGDPAAMAVRRGTQQQKAMNDLKQIGVYFNLYRTEAGNPTTDGFRKYIEGEARTAPALVKMVKDGDYVLNVPKGGDGILAYEKDKDYQGTRVVVMTDGSVQKTMSEADFQATLKKGR